MSSNWRTQQPISHPLSCLNGMLAHYHHRQSFATSCKGPEHVRLTAGLAVGCIKQPRRLTTLGSATAACTQRPSWSWAGTRRPRALCVGLESASAESLLSHGLHDVRRGRAARRLCRAAEQLLREEREGLAGVCRRVALLLRGHPFVVRRLRRRLSLLRGPSGARCSRRRCTPKSAALPRGRIGVAKTSAAPPSACSSRHQLPTHERAAVPELYLQLLLLRPQGHHTLLAARATQAKVALSAGEPALLMLSWNSGPGACLIR